MILVFILRRNILIAAPWSPVEDDDAFRYLHRHPRVY
jgi:hypothetical protein